MSVYKLKLRDGWADLDRVLAVPKQTVLPSIPKQLYIAKPETQVGAIRGRTGLTKLEAVRIRKFLNAVVATFSAIENVIPTNPFETDTSRILKSITKCVSCWSNSFKHYYPCGSVLCPICRYTIVIKLINSMISTASLFDSDEVMVELTGAKRGRMPRRFLADQHSLGSIRLATVKGNAPEYMVVLTRYSFNNVQGIPIDEEVVEGILSVAGIPHQLLQLGAVDPALALRMATAIRTCRLTTITNLKSYIQAE